MKGDDGYASIQKEKEGFVMRWIAISGSWRTVNEDVKKDDGIRRGLCCDVAYFGKRQY